MNRRRPYVIGISSVSGGGKTTVARELCSQLPSSVGLFFDDFDDTTVHPEDLGQWARAGGDYNVWQTPGIVARLEELNSRKEHDYVVFDAPLGRAHKDSGRFIDLMVYIDTPLDVAMARRLLRDYQPGCGASADGRLGRLRDNLSHYLEEARLPYLEMAKSVQPKSDLVLDGTLDPRSLASMIVRELSVSQAASRRGE